MESQQVQGALCLVPHAISGPPIVLRQRVSYSKLINVLLIKGCWGAVYVRIKSDPHVVHIVACL